MSRIKTITGLDIGTDTIKILGVKKDSESGIEVLFFDTIESFGVQKGRVKDSNEVAKRVSELIEKVERKHGCRVDNIFVNINGTKLQLVPSHALISVGRADQKVSSEDIERIYDEVKMINLQSNNKTILQVFPQEWVLDGEKEIIDPLGLQGVRLELDALLLSAFNSDIEGIIDSIEAVNLEEENIIPGLIADSNAVLTPNQKELGVALLNIGAGTSSVAVFEAGRLLNLVVFPVGSANITNDIAIGFKTEIEIAERIKKQHGSCSLKDGKKKIDFVLSPVNEEDEEEEEEDIFGKKKKIAKKKPKNVLSFSEKELSKIIEARVCEIFELADREIKKVSKQGLLPGGIVLTGGGSKLPGIIELAKKEFKLPCRIGYCTGFSGLEKDSSLSTVCGLVISKIDKEVSRSGSGSGIGKKIKGFFENFIP
jgi:cell division protein FtsA